MACHLYEDGILGRGAFPAFLFAPIVLNSARLCVLAAWRVGRLLRIPPLPRPILRRASVCRLPAIPPHSWLPTTWWDCLGRPRRMRNWGMRFSPTKSGDVAFELRGAAGHVLRRIMGRRSGAHGLSVGKTLTTQRAEVGFCPCYSPTTNVAMPGSCSIRARPAYKDVVTQYRQARGPWRPRRVSAFTSRRLAISRKIGIGRPWPSASIIRPCPIWPGRPWVVFVTRKLMVFLLCVELRRTSRMRLWRLSVQLPWW